MKNNIPEKIFDQHMHIVRDVHFDVDKYKIGELYVINHIVHPNYLHFGEPCKTVGYLKSASEHSLQFRTMKRREICNDTDAVYYIYAIDDFTLTIDEIIDKEIEIERLMTETEATVYLGMAVLDEAKQSTLDPKDPKFNRLLGIVPDHSQFPYILERTHSYQELQAAYKINNKEEAEDLAENSMLKIAEEVYDSSLDEYRNYTVDIPEMGEPFSFVNINWKFNTKAFENLCGKIEVTFRKGSNQIRFNTSNKFIFVTEDTIRILNRSGLNVTIYNKDFRESFDKIEFKVIQ
jgi:hypothetical protein